MSPKGAVIRDHVSRVFLAGAEVSHSLKVQVHRVGTLCISLISIRVSLVDPFILAFILLMGVNPIIFITAG